MSILPIFRDTTKPPPPYDGPMPAGCPMAEGLYLRANGGLSCWGHQGDFHDIGQLDLKLLRQHLGSSDLFAAIGLDTARLRAAEEAILAVDPGHRPASRYATTDDPPEDWLADVTLPETLRSLCVLRLARGESEHAHLVWSDLERRFPDDPGVDPCRQLLDGLAPLEPPHPTPPRRPGRWIRGFLAQLLASANRRSIVGSSGVGSKSVPPT